MIDELQQWVNKNFRDAFADEDPKQYQFERQMFMLIYIDAMQMELELEGRYPSEACDISWMAASSAWSYSWLI